MTATAVTPEVKAEAARREFPGWIGEWRTPGTAMADAIAALPNVVQVVETTTQDGTSVLVVVSDDRRASVGPIYEAEIAVAEEFAKSKFAVKVTRSAVAWDLAQLPRVTRQLFPRA